MISTRGIRTPDQRLRVFISSTIGELATERSAAREAIARLKLTPVFFESGARPHPPQELYRSYLQQSEVFVGIYASSYGWIAPGTTISGIEDEYHLSAGKPRLIYVKNVPDREERLTEMLADVQQHGAVVYQRFSTPEELSELLQNDLALLLAERFDIASQGPGAAATASASPAVSPTPLPVLRGKSVGRDKELAELRSWVADPDSALITLTGPGGTGKSRLALHLAHDTCASFTHGCAFVPLAAIHDPALVAATVARNVGLFDSGQRPVTEVLTEFLVDKSMLIVLDNFEHLLPAATLISTLLEHCPAVRIVATSRAPLRLREERIFPVQPLDARCDVEHDPSDVLLRNPAIQLFVQRAREVDPSLDLSDESVRALATLCIKLDGLPLAIELAAARARYLPPVALKSRIDKTLDLLSGGARDLPERQRTMRATINWSHDLLDETSRAVFRRLSVFREQWTLESAEGVAGNASQNGDFMDAIEKLVDLGLVHRVPWTAGDHDPRFTMMHVVQSFAHEQLEQCGEAAMYAERHAIHFMEHAAMLEHQRSLNDFGPHLLRLEDAYSDIRDAFWYWISAGRMEEALRIIGSMRGLWFYAGMVSEAFTWLEAVKIDDIDDLDVAAPDIKANALLTAGLAMMVAGRYTVAAGYLQRCVAHFRVAKDQTELPRSLAYLGVVMLSVGDRNALELLRESERLGRANRDDYSTCLALAFQTEAYLLMGDNDTALNLVEEAVAIADRQRAGVAHANVLLLKGNLLLMRGNHEEANASYRESLRIFDAVHMRAVKGWSHAGLAYSHFMTGDFDDSRREFLALLEAGRSTGDGAMIATGILGMSAIAGKNGLSFDGATLLIVAEELARRIDYKFWSTDKLLHQDLADRLHASLTDAEWKDAERRAAGMSREEMMRLATGVGSAV